MMRQRRPEGPMDPRPMGEKIDEFLADNPGFVDLCATFTRQFLRNTGATNVGVQAVIERVRWERAIQTKSEHFKVNNSFASYLSRLIMAVHPDLDGVFETRRADDADEWLTTRPELADGLFALPFPGKAA